MPNLPHKIYKLTKKLNSTIGIFKNDIILTTNQNLMLIMIRILKTWFYKDFSTQCKYKWLDILLKIGKQYSKVLGNMDVTPTSQLNLYNYPKIAFKSELRIGDNVRKSKYKGVFEKVAPSYPHDLLLSAPIPLLSLAEK